MIRKSFTFILIVCFSIYTGCVSVIKHVKVEKSEYSQLDNTDKIFLTTLEGEQYTFQNLTISNTHAIGTEFAMSDKKVQIILSDIESIEILGVRIEDGRLITKEEIEANITTNHRINSAVGLTLLMVLPDLFISLFVGFNFDEDGPNPTAFYVSFAGFTILNGYIGYKIGKRSDEKEAIKKIEGESKKKQSE